MLPITSVTHLFGAGSRIRTHDLEFLLTRQVQWATMRFRLICFTFSVPFHPANTTITLVLIFIGVCLTVTVGAEKSDVLWATISVVAVCVVYI